MRKTKTFKLFVLVSVSLSVDYSISLTSFPSFVKYQRLFRNTQHRGLHDSRLQVDGHDDADLIRNVSKDMLQRLCSQYNISTKGTKPQLIQRLRAYADQQIEDEKARRKDRIRRIEKGSDDDHDGTALSGKAKHTILDGSMADGNYDEDGEELDGVFYFPALMNTTATFIQNSNATSLHRSKQNITTSSAVITAPPLHPNIQPNEKGERSVTVYSTTDQNDLTSITSHLSAAAPDMMNTEALNPSSTAKKFDSTLLGGPFGESSNSQRKKHEAKETDMADEVLTDLVRNLLAMTGAPGFQEHSMDNEDEIITFEPLSSMNKDKNFVPSMTQKHDKFIGFDPSQVPTSFIMESSKYLRMNNGESLRKVLNEFEMQAIGFDGRAGDDKRRGGGHYKEVQKVAAFLHGFRVAEVRRVARQTTSLLLDKLISEGIQGLDRTLMVMSRGGDESSDVGELNDSLLSHLDQIIRDTEKKQAASRNAQLPDSTESMYQNQAYRKDDDFNFWNVSQTSDGVVETLNPNDPKIIKAFQNELINISDKPLQATIPAHEKLLTIVKLLRDRIKAEAFFPNDEKGQNLRVLAYCLKADSENDWANLINEYFGSSLGRLESFAELVSGAFEYAESTSHQLQPSISGPLNLKALTKIKFVVEGLREKQIWRASGISDNEQRRMSP